MSVTNISWRRQQINGYSLTKIM